MNFLTLQQELATVPGARFKSSQSVSYKAWLNARAAELWGKEDWTFRKAFETFSIAANDDTPTVPTTLGLVLGLWREDGTPVEYLPVADFARMHVGSTDTGYPDYYTVVNREITLHPTPSYTSAAWRIHYDRAYCHLSAGGAYVAGDMSADTDVPALPSECHYLLVHGATSMGSVNMNDFTYQFAEQAWQSGIEAMRRNFLAEVRVAGTQWGAGRL